MANRKLVLWAIAIVVLLLVSIVAVYVALTPQETTVEVPRFADTYISSTSPTKAHGLEPLLWLSRVSTGEENWTLITFDTMGRWRPGDHILSAVVHLRVAVSGSGTWPALVLGARVASGWSEENATWQVPPSMSFVENSTTALSTSPRIPDDVAVDVTTPFTYWITYGAPPNFSTVLAMGGSVENASVAFASQQNGTLLGPVLTVTFQTAPPGLYGYEAGAPSPVASWRSE